MDLSAALPIKLKLRVEGLVASVLYQSNSEWKPVISDIDLRSLSTEHAGGFVGCTLGLYASGNGEDAGGYSDFESRTSHQLILHESFGSGCQMGRECPVGDEPAHK